MGGGKRMGRGWEGEGRGKREGRRGEGNGTGPPFMDPRYAPELGPVNGVLNTAYSRHS